jgi:hypothetical protein
MRYNLCDLPPGEHVPFQIDSIDRTEILAIDRLTVRRPAWRPEFAFSPEGEMLGSIPLAIFLDEPPCRSDTQISDSRAKAILVAFCAFAVTVDPLKINRHKVARAETGAAERSCLGCIYQLNRVNRCAASTAFSFELNAETRK